MHRAGGARKEERGERGGERDERDCEPLHHGALPGSGGTAGSTARRTPPVSVTSACGSANTLLTPRVDPGARSSHRNAKRNPSVTTPRAIPPTGSREHR